MKYAVLGAGLMGKAVAYDLLQQTDTTEVYLADIKQTKLAEANWLLDDPRLKAEIIDVADRSQAERIMERVDVAISAVHYEVNLPLTLAAIKTKTHFCDLGGNSSVVSQQLMLDATAKKAGISVIPDCGLAPGMVMLLAQWGLERFDWVDTIKIRVGGLPKEPRGVLQYGRLFSVEGLINEYVEPVRVIRDGKTMEVEPLTDIELIEFPPPYGTLEAFNTSGGISTLVDTYEGRLRNLDYKTIRYPGHCHAFRAMYELGFLSSQPAKGAFGTVVPRAISAALIEKHLPLIEDDVTLVRVIFEGRSKSHRLTLIAEALKKPPLTAMMRTTAFPAAIVAEMQARGQIKVLGVVPQEKSVPIDLFLAALRKRDILIEGID